MTENKFNGWSKYDFARDHKLIERMAIEVVKGSPLLNLADQTAIGLVLSKIAYGVIEAELGPDFERKPEES